ncbi:MAG: vanadium-dependent haloperoxidase [Blastocatellia bacterium]
MSNQNLEAKHKRESNDSKEDQSQTLAAGPAPTSRRAFMGTVAAGVVALPPLLSSQGGEARAQEFEPQSASTGKKRAKQALNIRIDAADQQRAVPIPAHPDNGDEARYATKFANYSKGLKHDPSTGEVDLTAYNAFLTAINSGSNADFDSIVTKGLYGCPDPLRQRRQVNPQSAFAFDLEGTDSQQLAMRAAPAFASAEEAGEMVELYWMALLRDVNFQDYATNPLAIKAAADLSRLSDFRGPKIGGQVTSQTLFRDKFPGATDGPYISQFLLQPAGFGAQEVDQRINTNAPEIDFGTSFSEWLDIQNGFQPIQTLTPGGKFFCRNGRDLAQYVHVDVLYQAYFVAFLVIAGGGYPVDAGNPYGTALDPGSGRPLAAGAKGSISQTAFGTFGGPAVATLVTEPATRALKAQWFQKWMVHRRLRPEEFGGRVEVQRLGRRTYPFHSDLGSSSVLNEVFEEFATHLLPLAFPEGSPLHTSYGSGHATVAGASVTMLKAFFDESAVIKNPVVPSADGLSLVPYQGTPLTVGGELNKIASNVATGRNIAGVHWRTDATEAIKLGEDVSISILKDTKGCYNEAFNGFSLTKFDGTTITV